MFNMLCGGFFMLLCTSGPTVVQAWGVDHGLSDRGAWGVSGAIFGALALVCGFISWCALKGKEKPATEVPTSRNGDSIFKVLKETFSIKPYRRLCITTFILMIGYIISSSSTIYLLIYNCEMSGGQQAIFWVVYAVAYIAMVPLGSAIANTLGKKQSFIAGTLVTCIICLVLFILNKWSFGMAIFFVIIYQLASTVFWTNYLGFAYDCAEVDEYKNGKRREGSLCAVVSFAQKFGSAIGTYGTGTVLAITGYDAMAEVQSEGALLGISGACTLGVVISGVIGVLIMIRYPIGKKEYDLIIKATEDKKAGRQVDESGFKNCL